MCRCVCVCVLVYIHKYNYADLSLHDEHRLAGRPCKACTIPPLDAIICNPPLKVNPPYLPPSLLRNLRTPVVWRTPTRPEMAHVDSQVAGTRRKGINHRAERRVSEREARRH